jgi:phosphoribosyl 1,2-cyclic phosphate phosphodiesterase
VLTNLHIDLDYDVLSGLMPKGVEVGYDGWTTSLSL